MRNHNRLGEDWLIDQIDTLTDEIIHQTPLEFNEENRYLPDSVTPNPGYISYDLNPYMKEILACADPWSPVREVNLMKGVQITYTTLLESILFYYMAFVKTKPSMMISADKDLVQERVENNILPMLEQSGFSHIIQSSDTGNSRKTGKTQKHLQWEGGGYMIPAGANNAHKMRSWSILLMLKDEIDGWADEVGRDGCPDKLTDGRTKAYTDHRKIFRGSTPLIRDTSKIYKQFMRGDQRYYMVHCKSCNYPQYLKWETVDKETGVRGGFIWELEEGMLIPESVRYLCQSCGHEHYEHDKTKLFSEAEGAHWKPTARPAIPNIRSYKLPAMYSPFGMQPWHACVADYLDAFDPEKRQVKDIGAYQTFYNNILGEPFEVRGAKVRFETVSLHRRPVYEYGEIPNRYAEEYSGSKIIFLTCTVDLHLAHIDVTVFGWCEDMRSYLIDYLVFEDEDCTDTASPAWGKVRELIENKRYVADDGTEYGMAITLIDASYSNATVTTFCSDYSEGVYPILGRDRTAKNQRIMEFAPYTTKAGTLGFRILVDHYKDRMGMALRREWSEAAGPQYPYHFNAPMDCTDKQLKEMTTEYRMAKKDDRGATYYVWYRPHGVRNELWDLWGYGHAAVEIYAYNICIERFELENVDWFRFWKFALEPVNDKLFERVTPDDRKQGVSTGEANGNAGANSSA